MRRERLTEETPVPAELLSQSIPLVMPIAFLHGIKMPHEYQGFKKRSVRSGYAEKGASLLYEKPVYTTLIPVQNGGMITIFNGHHRTRYAPEFGIYSIPSLVFPLEVVSAFTQLPLDELVSKLHQWSNETIHAFSRSFARQEKTYHGPQVLSNVPSFSQLEKIGSHENSFGILPFAYIQTLTT